MNVERIVLCSVIFVLSAVVIFQLVQASETSTAQTLSLQRMCAIQSEKYFKDNRDTRAFFVSSYTNHYNAKMNRCFVHLQTLDASPGDNSLTIETLTDAFEGVDYGSEVSRDNGSKILCSLTPPHEPPVRCRSFKEWNDFVDRYME
jgi:hypothetical protein